MTSEGKTWEMSGSARRTPSVAKAATRAMAHGCQPSSVTAHPGTPAFASAAT